MVCARVGPPHDDGLQMNMVFIPGGPFLIGQGPAAHSLHMPSFSVARYPLTNAQYRCFIKAGGYEDPRDWTKAGWAWLRREGIQRPEGWDELAPRDDHPVVGVSWYEAVAYARWAHARLPTEAEWERAARGEEGWVYPWRDEPDPSRCNTREGGPQGTTPVGHYSPLGDSSYGLADMVGNVWEWCSSLFWPYPYRADDGREDPEAMGYRVLRGGSYLTPISVADCTVRSWLAPHERADNIGFRLAE